MKKKKKCKITKHRIQYDKTTGEPIPRKQKKTAKKSSKKKAKYKQNNRHYLSTKYRPIVISKITSDLFIKLPQKQRGRAITLFWFYSYTSSWQKTNSAYCKDVYVAKGLGWEPKTVAKYRKMLQRMGLIKKVRDGKTGNTYIEINFYYHEEVVRSAEDRKLIEVIVGFQIKNQDREIRLLRKLLLNSLDKDYVFTEQEKSQIGKAKRNLPCIDMMPKVLREKEEKEFNTMKLKMKQKKKKKGFEY